MLNNSARRDRAWITAHIPHQGSMCLLDEVLTWNETQVRCLCRTHRSLDNPLRARGRLAAICGIEIASQAIAVHGALTAPLPQTQRRSGFLAGVRNVSLHTERLDDYVEDLIATVNRVGGDDATILYDFDLSVSLRSLVAGRALIVMSRADGNPGAAR